MNFGFSRTAAMALMRVYVKIGSILQYRQQSLYSGGNNCSFNRFDNIRLSWHSCWPSRFIRKRSSDIPRNRLKAFRVKNSTRCGSFFISSKRALSMLAASSGDPLQIVSTASNLSLCRTGIYDQSNRYIQNPLQKLKVYRIRPTMNY